MVVKYRKITYKDNILVRLIFPDDILFFDIPYLKISYLGTTYYIPPSNFKKIKKIRFTEYIIPMMKKGKIKILNNFNEYCYYIFNERRKVDIKLKLENV